MWAWSKELGDFGSEEAVQYADQARTITCNAQPLTTESAFRRWGIEISRPWRIFINASDAEHVREGDRIQFGDRIMIVRVPPVTREQGLMVDHADFGAQEVTQSSR